MGLPVEINPLFVSSTGGYTVGRSLRFRSSASAYLNRTLTTPTSGSIWTYSLWVKRGALNSNQQLLSAGASVSDQIYFQGGGTDKLIVYLGASQTTTQVFRDPSAWYHFVFAVDTTQATASNRLKIYLNGSQITAFDATGYPTQNSTTKINSAVSHYIGRYAASASDYVDGYLAEVNFIDGQALTPSSFGAYDTNGVWQPAKYTGTYGTNGFYLPFSNTSSTTTLVADASGNGNNWTPNNISLTAGTTYDSMIDSPTVSASSSNYAVMNPNFVTPSTTFSNGNLTLTKTGNTDVVATSTIAMPSGKWYWEITITSLSASSNLGIGIVKNTTTNGSWVGALPAGVYFNSGAGVYRYGSNITGTLGTTFATNDILGLALDMDAGTLALYKNNTLIYTVSGVDTTTPHYAFWDSYANGESASFNFGQRPFSYTPPTGYSALNTYNLPAATIKNGAQYMAATLYTGNGGTQTINNGTNTTIGTSFQPDFVWIKNRAAAVNHQLQNSNAGWQYGLNSNNTNAEYTDANAITGATSSGWSMNNNYNSHNQSGVSYVGWNWQAGAGTTSTNTSGSITSTVSVNTQSGFSIATYAAQPSGTATIGHGLGVAPSMVILKSRASAYDWAVYHSALGNTQAIRLNLTSAANTDVNWWNNTSPTSSVFTVGANYAAAGNTVAYCFAAVRGYSAFGSYTGNGSTDGPFIYTGFRPRWILFKRSDSAQDWMIIDSSRDTYNVAGSALWPDLSNYENQSSVPANSSNVDFLSNGFKIRNPASGSGYNNASGGTYIYAAFAENPFNYSRAR